MNTINTLSVFNGMGCGYIALERAGFEIGKYYASEIKTHAINFTKRKQQKTIHLGDIKSLKVSDLDSKIDLYI